jgi:hypothetical protein
MEVAIYNRQLADIYSEFVWVNIFYQLQGFKYMLQPYRVNRPAYAMGRNILQK